MLTYLNKITGVNGLLARFVFALVFLLGVAELRADSSEREIEMIPQVKFRAILPDQLEKLGFINDIAQDKHGYLWFGAIKGLARYDGYSIKVYQADSSDPNALVHNWVKSFLVTKDGQFWAVTHHGLCAYSSKIDGFDCVTLKTPPSYSYRLHTFYSMFEDNDGRIWVSSSAGLLYLNPNRRTFHEAPEVLTDFLPPLPSSEDNFVHEFDQHGDYLWLAMEGNGLVRYSFSTGQIKHYLHDDKNPESLGSNKVRELAFDSNGTLWVGGLGGGLQKYHPQTDGFELIHHSASEKADTVWSIIEDQTGLLWIGDGNGVHIYNPQTEEFADYRYTEGQSDGPGNFVNRIVYQDAAGGIWTGYFPSGIDTVDLQASQFLNYRHNPNLPDSLADGGVLATVEDEKGNLWVGCGFGLSYLDRKSGQFERYQHQADKPDSLSGSTILDMDFSADGSLWIGAWDRGLNRKLPGQNKFQRYIQDPADPKSLMGREPWAVFVDRDDILWVGTEKAFNRFNAKTQSFEQFYPVVDGMPIEPETFYVRDIIQDQEGMLWVASFNGLYVFDPIARKFIKTYRFDEDDPASLSLNQVISIFESRAGEIWVGTNGSGLNRLMEDGKFRHYGIEDGLPDLSISGIVDDENGDIWVSTFQGLVRIKLDTEQISVFDKRDGPVGNLYNRKSPSRLKSGELVFGSSRGLTIFDPQNIKPNSHIAPIVLTNFAIFNEPVRPGPESPLSVEISETNLIELTYKQSVFSIQYASLDYVSPLENNYAYRMKGFEDKWNYVGNRRTATYTNLDPGHYVFQVKGSNNSGVWNETPRELMLVIQPPFWKTKIAYLIYLMVLLFVVARAWRTQKNKIAYERQRYEQERAIVARLKEVDQMKDQINRDLDQKVAERTEELRQEHQRLTLAQQQLEQLNEKLEYMSLTDQLTGLKNRRFLHQSIDDDIAIVERAYKNAIEDEWLDDLPVHDLSFIILDVDDFKPVNDQYGHKAGDILLVQLSNILKRQLRQSDFLVRWGGEEFVIVVRHLPRNEMPRVVERIREAVIDHVFDLGGGIELRKSLSIGYASYPFCKKQPTAISWEQVISVADHALYSAKRSGKNCWVGLECVDSVEDPHALIKQIEQGGIAKQVGDGKLIVSSSRPQQDLTW